MSLGIITNLYSIETEPKKEYRAIKKQLHLICNICNVKINTNDVSIAILKIRKQPLYSQMQTNN